MDTSRPEENEAPKEVGCKRCDGRGKVMMERKNKRVKGSNRPRRERRLFTCQDCRGRGKLRLNDGTGIYEPIPVLSAEDVEKQLEEGTMVKVDADTSLLATVAKGEYGSLQEHIDAVCEANGIERNDLLDILFPLTFDLIRSLPAGSHIDQIRIKENEVHPSYRAVLAHLFKVEISFESEEGSAG